MSSRGSPPGAPRAAADEPTAAARYRVDRLRLRHLRLLQRIQHTGSLRKAAEAIGVSQPAASLLLREVEAVFEATLVVRMAKGCRLTDAGADALDRLAIALAAVDRAIDATRERHGAPALRVGSVQLAGATILPATLARLERLKEDVRIDIREGRANELLRELLAGNLDCVIGWVDRATLDPLPLDRLRLRLLWQGRMEVVAATDHPLARKRAVALAELQDQRWIVAHEGTRMHAAFVQLFAQSGVNAPLPAVTCSAVHTALALVARTRLLAMAPDVLVAAYAAQRRVKALRGTEFRTDASGVSLITRRENESLPALRGFRDALLVEVAAR